MSQISATAIPSSAVDASPWVDWAGMIASIGCAIHCAAMPLVLAYLPALGLGWLAGEGFHKWMALVCFALAAAAFVPGWRKHGSFVPALWAAAGLMLLTTAAFGLEGSCCAGCLASADIQIGTAPCSDADCLDCRITAAEAPGQPSLIEKLTPLVTPLGGILLVVGHIANHRKTCACRQGACCLGSASSDCDG